MTVLSYAPSPERFCLGVWPDRLKGGVWSCTLAAAHRIGSPVLLADPDFQRRVVREGLIPELTDEALDGLPGAGDLATVLVILTTGEGWVLRGALSPLELQAFPPLCRILGVEQVEARFREACLAAIWSEPLSGECHSPNSPAPPPRGPR